MKIENEVASLYYYINGILDIQAYFDEVPQDMIIPCVFYPTPEFDVGDFSLGTFSTDFSLYINIFGKSNIEAAYNASLILGSLAADKRRVPIVNESGAHTDQCFRISRAEGRKIDEGVYQLSITWKRYTAYTRAAATKAKDIYINDAPI